MISTLVHTYNEGKNLDRALSSLDWADEIIVVDMGSTDDTLKIAAKYQARIYHHPYTGFVEPARNFGIEKAKHDWVMVLDADEEVPASLRNILKEHMNNGTGDYYRIPRKNIIFGKWIKRGGWWPDYQIRFFRKGSVKWENRIHSFPLTYGDGVDLPATEGTAIVHHNYQTIEQYLNRLNRYTNINAKEFYFDNVRVSYLDLLKKPAREFINRFFAWEGYKDGVHGLSLAMLQSFSELVLYLKLWELDKFKEQKMSLGSLNRIERKILREKTYWYISTEMKETKNIAERTFLKLKRKISGL